ncbi:MAG: O-antigen ligase family protein, partial [Planctomycetes bacterium]|nr:O-antigen ligase family protein [Planctomycetota bacterium]
MIRLTALAIVVAVLCGYAWRNWFVSLCGLILLTVLSQHRDMPHAMFGVPGLNPWNLLLGVIFVVWLVQRRPGVAHLPRWFAALFLSYVGMLVVGGIRAMLDTEGLAAKAVSLGPKELLLDLILNPLKYLLVGVLFFDGCRTRRRAWLGVLTVLLLGLAHSLMMYKTMKGLVFLGNYEDARRMTDKMIGLHANDLAAVLTMAFWSAIVVAMVVKSRWRWAAIAVAAVVLPTIVGCHSRSAYLANAVLALALAVVRWRKLLMVFPIAALASVAVFPQIVNRLAMGFDATETSLAAETDWNQVTAGRTGNLWNPAIDQIVNAPLIGHGRLAIWRTPCYDEILASEGSVPSHPHNSYLEVLLDSGVVGLFIVLGLLG